MKTLRTRIQRRAIPLAMHRRIGHEERIPRSADRPMSRRASNHRLSSAISLALAGLLFASCGSSSAPTSTTSSSMPAPVAHTKVSLYWVRDGAALGVSHRMVIATSDPEKVVMNALLAGPTSLEKAAGLASTIPAGSRLLSLTTSNGLATTNFNSTFASGGGSFSVRARLAQVVFTLTQFVSIRRVLFEVNGAVITTFSSEGIVLDHALTRSDEVGLLPPIFVEQPAVGDSISSPTTLSGLANTFEAVFEVELVDAEGHVVLRQQIHASSGTGTWGVFKHVLYYSEPASGAGELVAFELSAKDGSRIHEVSIPLTFNP